MTIGARIDECIAKLLVVDAENAFIQLAIAIDGTAKRQYPSQRTTDRCKRFLRENLPFVLWSLTNGTPARGSEFTFEFSGSGVPNRSTKFEDLVYSVMRCALLHEGEMPSKVEFVTASYIGMLGGRMQFPVALIGALLFAVVASPVNVREKVADSSAFFFGETRVPVAEILGSLQKTKAAIRLGFLYDVEALLAKLESDHASSAEA